MGDNALPEKMIGRLAVYRRILSGHQKTSGASIRSHELATVAGVSASQVRRDMMALDITGSPNKGYDKQGLIRAIGMAVDQPEDSPVEVALVGLGNLGRALVNYTEGLGPRLHIKLIFDTDPDKVDRLYRGIPCHPVTSLREVLADHPIVAGIIAVPAAAAQEIANQLVVSGVTGILNFAPVPLLTPAKIFVLSMDLTTALETVAYYAAHHASPTKNDTTETSIHDSNGQ